MAQNQGKPYLIPTDTFTLPQLQENILHPEVEKNTEKFNSS